MTAKWGNPETKSFERQYLRWARYDETAVHVHKHIWPMVERILIGLDEMGLDARSVTTNEDDPLHLSFRLPVGDVEDVNAMVRTALFEYADGVVRFTGTPELAVNIASMLVPDGEDETEPEPEVVAAAEPRAAMTPPYGRTFDDPATVRLMQTLILPPSAAADGVAGEELRLALMTWQERRGIERTGELDTVTWTHILPKRVTWMRPGATGAQVKVLQAAFIERGYLESGITGVWGIQMSQALRRFQHDYGIHPRLRIGNPEWAALFGDTRTS